MIKPWKWTLAACLLAATSAGAHSAPKSDEPPIPALSRAWMAADYQVVTAAIAQGRIALPRFGEGDSDALMRRLVSEDNLAFHANASVPAIYRLQDWSNGLPSILELLKSYLEDPTRNHAELAAVMAYAVRDMGVGANLLAEVLPTIPKDDTYEDRMKGLAQVKSGFTNVLLGAETSLGEAVYSAQDKSLMLDAMADSIDPLVPFLADDVKAELAMRLKARKGAGTKVDDENIERIVRALVVTS